MSADKFTRKPQSPGSDRAQVDLLRQKIGELVLKSPAKAAVILADWLKKGASSVPRKKAG